MSWRHCLPSHR